VAVLSNEGGSEDLLCEITLGRRQTYDDDLPEEVALDVLLDLAFVRVDLESLVQRFGQLGAAWVNEVPSTDLKCGPCLRQRIPRQSDRLPFEHYSSRKS
jgi:hypothetical protein